MSKLPPLTSRERLIAFTNSSSILSADRNKSFFGEPILAAQFFILLVAIVTFWVAFLFADIETESKRFGYVLCSILTVICGFYALRIYRKNNLRLNGNITNGLIVKIVRSVSADGDTCLIYYDFLSDEQVVRGQERLSGEVTGLSEGCSITVLHRSNHSRVWRTNNS
jgi:hypothetical protein